MGYYVPYLHNVPLWEMENDYYLHNHHVKAGKGTLHTMKAYQQFFGIDCNDDEKFERRESSSSSHNTDNRVRSSQTSIYPPPPNQLLRNVSDRSAGGESRRIANVRQLCIKQSNNLSHWWKVSIQQNIQQRMWMQVGCTPPEARLPPRFDRLYQPEKLAQFDRFFARTWANPVRQSHSAQHSKVTDDEPASREFRRNVSSADRKSVQEDQDESISDQEMDRTKSLDDFVNSYGLQPHFKPTLKSMIKHHDRRDSSKGATRKENEGNGGK